MSAHNSSPEIETRLEDVCGLIEALQACQSCLLELSIDDSIELCEWHCADDTATPQSLAKWNRAVLLLETARRATKNPTQATCLAEIRLVLSRIVACLTPQFYQEQRRYIHVNSSVNLGRLFQSWKD